MPPQCWLLFSCTQFVADTLYRLTDLRLDPPTPSSRAFVPQESARLLLKIDMCTAQLGQGTSCEHPRGIKEENYSHQQLGFLIGVFMVCLDDSDWFLSILSLPNFKLIEFLKRAIRLDEMNTPRMIQVVFQCRFVCFFL